MRRLQIMAKEPYSQLSKGTFIIASPDINAGMYFRGVILLCEHGPSGSFGILVNKVLDVEIPEEVINMKDIANPRVQIRAGGPLQPNQMMLVHSSDQQPDLTLKLCDGIFFRRRSSISSRSDDRSEWPRSPSLFWILRLGPWPARA